MNQALETYLIANDKEITDIKTEVQCTEIVTMIFNNFTSSDPFDEAMECYQDVMDNFTGEESELEKLEISQMAVVGRC